MFTALLADDEINILNLLEKLIDWNALNIEVIGKCQSGSEAYQAIISRKPDIVIIDIKMPGLSGLDVVRQIQEEGIFPNFILISGHKQFEYARSAIQYGVENYLVKPINKQELTDNLVQIIHRIEKEQTSKDYKVMLEQQIKTNIALSREQFLKMLYLSPDLSARQPLEEINRQYGFHFVHDHYRVISIKPDTKELFTLPQYQILLKQIYEFITLKLEDYPLVTYGIIEADEIMLLINYASEEDLACSLASIFETLKNKFYSYCYITMGISSTSVNLFQVSFQEARIAIMSRITLGKDRMIDYNGLSRFRLKLNKSHLLDQFGTYIDTLNIAGVEKTISQLLQEISDESVSPVSIFDLFISLIQLLDEHLTDLYNKTEENFTFPRKQYVSQIHNSTSKEELVQSMKHIMIKEITSYEKLQYSKDSRYISLAKQYIYDHIDQNITLNDVAEVLFINPSYFSALFKRETGETFSNYITGMRMKRSKELLKNLQYSIADVSSMVGYQDSKYFSKVFQKTVGIKPSQYRKLYTN